jgi:AraC-like DNA-binding protein
MLQGNSNQDFASAALVSLLLRALAEAGLHIPQAPKSKGSDALLPMSAKRDLLAAIASAHGLRAIVKAGRNLPHASSDPVVAALLGATDAPDLFARWSRLERFVHSRHRVEVLETGHDFIVAEHVSLTSEPPRAFEDALILGVMAGALRAIGLTPLAARLGRDPDAPLIIADRIEHEPEPGQPTAVWRFEWQEVRRPAEKVDPATSDRVAALRRIVAADPARGWTLAAAASAMAMSTRSLQRALEPAGGFGTLIGAVRVERAGDLIINSAHPLSLIGFACGYADQPHFTREFKRRTAMTPAVYRQSFCGRSSTG